MFRNRKHVSEMTLKEKIAYLRQKFPVRVTLRITDTDADRSEELNKILGLSDAEFFRTAYCKGLDEIERELLIQKEATIKPVCLPA